MARRNNELFIGEEFLNLEGRSIKHPSLISVYATPNVNKITDDKIDLIGLDIETNHKTAELKLLGVWNGEKYSYYTSHFLQRIYSLLKHCDFNDKSLAYWNKLDPFIIFKQFLKVLHPTQQQRAMERYGKIGGKWNRQKAEWDITPLVEVAITNSNYSFGILNVIRSSIQFFTRRKNSKYINKIWAYDIASLYKSGLEKEMTSRKDLFPYYSKISKDAHLVNWDKFNNDEDYKNNVVLKSNEYDARAVYDLGNLIQEQFKEAFGQYSRTLISTGSLARASIVATITHKYKDSPLDEKVIKRKILDDIKSIGFINHYDKWYKELGDKRLKDFYCLTTEAYSGGYIEAIRYGYVKEGYYSDIASAYPAIIKDLFDLRDAKITYGKGKPPHIKNSYCFIRGEVNIPHHIDYHPITVKHPTNLETNIRAVGEYKASYTLEERDFLISLGASFKNEEWYNIETKGIISTIGQAVKDFYELRKRLIKEGNSAEYMAKISMNSAYGILFEAVDTYGEDNDFNIFRTGYRGGEFFNPIYASIITSRTRLLISKAVNNIEKQGGNPVLIMTDAIFWEGSADMMPKELMRDTKTLGFFEKPVHFKDMACLGSGRYTYYDVQRKSFFTKNRGLNVADFHRPKGLDIGAYNWLNAFKIAEHTNSLKIKVKVRSLVSVGMILHNSAYNVDNLGLVVEEDREVDLITGLTKRLLTENIERISQITKSSIKTKSIYLDYAMFGKFELNDQTLPKLRAEIMKKVVKTAQFKDMNNRNKASNKFAKKKRNKRHINSLAKKRYKRLRDLGIDSKRASKLSKWSDKRLHDTLLKEGIDYKY